ncbi:MAG: response regulator [Nitrospiraceae bacterium]
MDSRARRVLVVDDSEEIRTLMACFLTGEGYLVSEACDGTEALKRLQVEPFDVVVTDFEMPGLNGLEVMAHAHEQDNHRPVIIVSGLGTDLSRRAVELGAYAWLTKPLSRHLFLDIVNSAATIGQREPLPVASTA